MKKIAIVLLAAISLIASPYSFASQGRDGGSGRNGNDDGNEAEVRIEERREIRRDDDRVRIEIRQEVRQNDEVNEVRVSGNTFEVRGNVTEIFENSFTVSGNQIFVEDTNLLNELTDQGLLKLDEKVKVEGIISDNRKFAREIVIFRDGTEIKIEVKNVPAVDSEIEIRARGPLDRVTELLQQILSFIRGRST